MTLSIYSVSRINVYLESKMINLKPQPGAQEITQIVSMDRYHEIFKNLKPHVFECVSIEEA